MRRFRPSFWAPTQIPLPYGTILHASCSDSISATQQARRLLNHLPQPSPLLSPGIDPSAFFRARLAPTSANRRRRRRRLQPFTSRLPSSSHHHHYHADLPAPDALVVCFLPTLLQGLGTKTSTGHHLSSVSFLFSARPLDLRRLEHNPALPGRLVKPALSASDRLTSGVASKRPFGAAGPIRPSTSRPRGASFRWPSIVEEPLAQKAEPDAQHGRDRRRCRARARARGSEGTG